MANNLDTQFKKLIRDPLLEIELSLPSCLVVTLDALDECEDLRGVLIMIGALIHYAPSLPIKFLLTSSPELVSMLPTLLPRVVQLYQPDQASAQQEIAGYLMGELDGRLSAGQAKLLAEHANGSFIHATICIRFIWSNLFRVGSSGYKPVSAVLETILKQTTTGENQDPLDGLYMKILTSALEDMDLKEPMVQKMKNVLWTILSAQPSQSPSIDILSGLLDLKREYELQLLLGPLQSLLHTYKSGEIVYVTIFHQSFYVFMMDPQRSGMFYRNPTQQSHLLAARCMNIMLDMLQFNIRAKEIACDLDTEISGLLERVEKTISAELVYACRYWGAHVCNTTPSDLLVSTISQLLSHHLLDWMTVLNLKGYIQEGISVLGGVERWIHVSKIVRELYRVGFSTNIAFYNLRNVVHQLKSTALYQTHAILSWRLQIVQHHKVHLRSTYPLCQTGQLQTQ